MDPARLQQFEQELTRAVRGETLFDPMSLLIYSTDASLYQMKPCGVFLPKDGSDVLAAVRVASEHGVPILPRGGGTSLAGQTVSQGLVVDFSKHMDKVLEVNREERWARVQPGVVLDNLNAFLSSYDLFFAPDVATSTRANIGGMIGNNSSGVRSVRYGKTVDHVLGTETILSTGDKFCLKALAGEELEAKLALETREGEIYRRMSRLVEENRAEIEARFPKVMRRVSGYNLDELLGEELNLAKLMVGSEGTLGLVTEAYLNLEPIPGTRRVLVLHFAELLEGIRTVSEVLRYNPSAVEVLDRYGLELAYANPSVAALCRQFVTGDPDAILIVELSGDDGEEIDRSCQALLADSRIRDRIFHAHQARESVSQKVVWDVRKNALGVMLGVKGDYKPLPFIEDSCVPVQHLADYVSAVQEICAQHGRRLALYAHASVGVIHLRPLLNLKQAEDVEILASISDQVFQLVQKYGGSWSGEHGDGLVRSYKIPEFFGDRIYRAFEEVKRIFDPAVLMNPGKIVDAQKISENLRIHPEYRTEYPATYYRFEQEGGFDHAIEMCTGVGQCRKTISGVMCPSYIATRDEEHSTRGRANALRSAIAGDLGSGAFTSPRLYEVLDLCLECKACKSECPSSVDMAKMKAEFLAHYYEEHGLPLGKRLVAMTRQTAEWADRTPSVANLAMTNRISRWLLEKFAGFDQRRRLPRFAQLSLTDWWRNRESASGSGSSRVVLLADTFVNYYEPDVGVAAWEVLSALGYRVDVQNPGCCGRPLISAGLLREARNEGGKLIAGLDDGTQDPIIVLEPSCYSTIKDDHLDLLENREATRRVVDRVFSLEEFLAREEVLPELVPHLVEGSREILFHGHCQQKSLIGSVSSLAVLRSIPGAEIQEVPEGCCGMAGSFGYEKEHYELSKTIGERNLLPMVRESGERTLLAVSGFSCRSQVNHFTGRQALHPSQIIAAALRK